MRWLVKLASRISLYISLISTICLKWRIWLTSYWPHFLSPHSNVRSLVSFFKSRAFRTWAINQNGRNLVRKLQHRPQPRLIRCINLPNFSVAEEGQVSHKRVLSVSNFDIRILTQFNFMNSWIQPIFPSKTTPIKLKLHVSQQNL